MEPVLNQGVEGSGPTRIVDGLYQLQDVLGRGAMGEIYRATNRMTRDLVALKLLLGWKAERDPGEAASNESTNGDPQLSTGGVNARLSFAREFQILASLHHPNVVQVLNYGFDAVAGPYFTMELLPSPRTLLEAAAEQSIEARVDLLVQLLRALSYVHRRGVIHRDLKPSNVLVVGAQVKVLDFGIATAKETAPMAGTIGYIAPEVILGRAPSIASDLFCVGVIAYQVLSGRFPYEEDKNVRTLISRMLGADADQTLDAPVAHLLRAGWTVDADENETWTLRPLGDLGALTAPLNRIVLKLLSTRPADRHASAEEVLRELGEALGRVAVLETSETRESLLQASEFVGRAAEMARLVNALHEARAGKGSAWLVGGESGVGKSRLIDELRTQALVSGAQVVRARAITERGGQFELWTLVLRTLLVYAGVSDEEAGVLKSVILDTDRLIGRPVPEAPPAPPIEAQQRFFRVVRSLLSRYPRPLVLLFEDLQWAGNDSLLLLGYLRDVVPSSPLLIVANYRDDESPQLPEALPGFARMKLGRLSEEDVGNLTVSILGAAGRSPELVRFLLRETEGNVFFLVEVLRALAEDASGLDRLDGLRLPERVMTGGIEQIIQRRLARVSQDGRGSLQVAAVAGRQLDLPVLRAVAGAESLERWLDDCANAAVLEAHGGEWLFAHDKLREHLLAELAPDPTRELHRSIARAIETLYPGSSAKFPILAHHYQKAGDDEKACAYFVKSGNLAARMFSTLDARKYYGEALAAFSRLPETAENRRGKVDVTTQFVAISFFSQSPRQAIAQIDEAASVLQSIALSDWSPADHLRAARLSLWGGRAYYACSCQSESLERYRRGLDAAGRAQNPQVTALLRTSIGQSLMTQGSFVEGRPYLEEACEWLAQAGEWPDWTRACGHLGMAVAAMGEFSAGIRLIQAALQRTTELKYSTYVAFQYIYLSVLQGLREDWKHSLESAQQIVTHAAQAQDWVSSYVGLRFGEWASLWLGHGAAAQDLHRQAMEIYRRIGACVIDDMLRCCDIDRALLQGRHDEAIALAGSALTQCRQSGNLLAETLVHRGWGRALSAQGRHAEAEAEMAESFRAARAGGAGLNMARTQLAWAEVCRARGDEDGANGHTRLAATFSAEAALPLAD
jgi:serine/threonine protein kinase/tetratricopeptide (TPR) repeat protein